MSEVVFKIEDLARISGLTRRTIRYYIQMGLLAKPVGERRGAHYLQSHLETLLRIRRLAEDGLSLQAIGERLKEDNTVKNEPPPSFKLGTTRTCVHMAVAEGVELTVDPAAAKLTAAQLRDLVCRIAQTVRCVASEDGFSSVISN